MKWKMTGDKNYYTVSEAARELSVSVPTVWRWVNSGKLRAYRIGGRTIRIRREDLAAMVTPARERSIAETATEAYGAGTKVTTMAEWERTLAEINRLHARILKRRGGKPLPSSVELIREAREERFNDL